MSRTEQEIQDTIRVSNITTSFSIDMRNSNGGKTSSFASVTVKCADEKGWTPMEADLVHVDVSFKVTYNVYLDMLMRNVISKDDFVLLTRDLTTRHKHMKNTRLKQIGSGAEVLDENG